MSQLLEKSPYVSRDDCLFLDEMNRLSSHHIQWCPEYRAILDGENSLEAATTIEKVPFVHVGLFKRLLLLTMSPYAKPGRTVLSSSTSGAASRIQIDEHSAVVQAQSSKAILGDFLETRDCPLLILDSAQSLRRRDDFSARIMAAMSLKPFASEIFFLLRDAADPQSLSVQQLECALKPGGDLLVYGFSWLLWLIWSGDKIPAELRKELGMRRISFVHSGGWKKLESIRVDRETFDKTMLTDAGRGSVVIDYYGLVEQMGVIFPLCSHGSRHVPRWADVIVRDSWTLDALQDGEGQLQLLNSITWGSPCHSVLTEDMGKLLPGVCPCGREGKRFELLGRVPKAEARGCANV